MTKVKNKLHLDLFHKFSFFFKHKNIISWLYVSLLIRILILSSELNCKLNGIRLGESGSYTSSTSTYRTIGLWQTTTNIRDIVNIFFLLSSVYIYTGSCLQPVRLVQAPGYEEQFFSWWRALLIDIKFSYKEYHIYRAHFQELNYSL